MSISPSCPHIYSLIHERGLRGCRREGLTREPGTKHSLVTYCTHTHWKGQGRLDPKHNSGIQFIVLTVTSCMGGQVTSPSISPPICSSHSSVVHDLSWLSSFYTFSPTCPMPPLISLLHIRHIQMPFIFIYGQRRG